jgi:hypothetical protein
MEGGMVQTLKLHICDQLYVELQAAAAASEQRVGNFAADIVESSMAARRLSAAVCVPAGHNVPEREQRSYMGSSLQHFYNEESLDYGEAAGSAGYAERATDAPLHESVQAPAVKERTP